MRDPRAEVAPKPLIGPAQLGGFRPLHELFAAHRQLAHRHDDRLADPVHRALGVGVKLADRFDSVAKELDAVRGFVGGRKHVENTAPEAELADRSDGLFANIAACDQQIDYQLGRHVFARAKRDARRLERTGRDRAFGERRDRCEQYASFAGGGAVQRERALFERFGVGRGAVVRVGFERWNRQHSG